MDPEVKAKADVAAALDGLDRSTVARVLRWASERYGLAQAAPLTANAPASNAGAAPLEDEGALY